jgi:hypothetical protein
MVNRSDLNKASLALAFSSRSSQFSLAFGLENRKFRFGTSKQAICRNKQFYYVARQPKPEVIIETITKGYVYLFFFYVKHLMQDTEKALRPRTTAGKAVTNIWLRTN